jgi:transcriptional regulator with XRE-family HTH domain
MGSEVGFSARLRWWRERRGLSQLALAEKTGISQRHLSFLELDRSSPSREMVLRLAMAIDIPLRQQNALMLAAGYAPEWQQHDLSAPDLAEVTRALDFMLAQQEPYPGVVVDRHWNLLKANTGAVRLVEFLVGPIAPGAAINLADSLVGPNALRPYLVNWSDVVRHFLRSVEVDASEDGLPQTVELYERLLAYEGVRSALDASPATSYPGPVLALHFRKQNISLRLFTTIATLGTPRDITLQELRVECFFPIDDSTGNIFKRWATATRRDKKASNS